MHVDEYKEEGELDGELDEGEGEGSWVREGSCMRGWDSCMCVKERGSYMRIFREAGARN